MVNTHQKLREHIQEHFMYGQPFGDDSSSLLNGGIIDSFGAFTLAAGVEELFGITIDSGEISPDNFDSINVLAAMVNKKLSEATA